MIRWYPLGFFAVMCWSAQAAPAKSTAPDADAPAVASTVLQQIRQAGTVRLAYRESAVPFSYVVNGKPTGYSIDLCMRVVAAIRTALAVPTLRVAWVPVTPATRIDAIAGGLAHLECGTTTNTRQRREQVAFTIPHFIAGTRMLVKADSGINDWKDLRGKPVALAAATTTLAAVRSLPVTHAIGVDIVEAPEVNDALSLLDADRVNAVAADNVQLAGLAAAGGDRHRYAVRGSMLAIEPYSLMLPKGDPEFKKLVDRAMVASIHEGETQQLYRKWFLSPIPPRNVALEIPMGYLLMESFRFPSDKVAD